MILTEPVYRGDVPVGTVELEKQGMFYRIRCRCAVADKEEYLLCCVRDDGTAHLGIYRTGNELVVRAPIKEIGSGQFVLTEKDPDLLPIFQLDDAESIITILKNLPYLQMVHRKGEVGVIIRYPEQDLPGSDRSR